MDYIFLILLDILIKSNFVAPSLTSENELFHIISDLQIQRKFSVGLISIA